MSYTSKDQFFRRFSAVISLPPLRLLNLLPALVITVDGLSKDFLLEYQKNYPKSRLLTFSVDGFFKALPDVPSIQIISGWLVLELLEKHERIPILLGCE